ncbi:hypothetical protein ABT061_23520 [Streptosporangium sp. NPDC002544]
MWVRGRLDGLWHEDFAGWYPRDGRPGLSPAQLRPPHDPNAADESAENV